MNESILIQLSKQELAAMIEAAVSRALVITKKEDELPPVLTLSQTARYYDAEHHQGVGSEWQAQGDQE